MRRDCCKATRRLPGGDNDRTPDKRKRGQPQNALKQATERTDGDKEEKVTFVTDRQPEKRPKKSIGDKRQNDDYMKILKGRFKYYCV